MLEFHPVTEIFPLMQGEQYDQLVQDIRENDLQEPIWLHEGQIIDGRNRYRACLDAGVEARFRTWNGEGSLIQFIVSLNLHRRHLTSSQRAAAAAEALEQLKAEAKARQRAGGKDKVPQKIGVASKHEGEATHLAAKMFGTNRTYVQEAIKLKGLEPEIFKAVMRGEMNLPGMALVHNELALLEGIKGRAARLDLSPANLVALAEFARTARVCPVNEQESAERWPARAIDLCDEGNPFDEALAQARGEYEGEIEARDAEEKRQEKEKERQRDIEYQKYEQELKEASAKQEAFENLVEEAKKAGYLKDDPILQDIEWGFRSELKHQIVSLGIDAKRFALLVNACWELAGKPSSQFRCLWADKWWEPIGPILDLIESEGTAVEDAVRQITTAIQEKKDQEKAEREEEERQEAEKEEREWQEREPFEFFAEFLLGNAPGLGAYVGVQNYERLIRHLKNCKLTKLTTAIEKMAAEWRAEDEQQSA